MWVLRIGIPLALAVILALVVGGAVWARRRNVGPGGVPPPLVLQVVPPVRDQSLPPPDPRDCFPRNGVCASDVSRPCLADGDCGVGGSCVGGNDLAQHCCDLGVCDTTAGTCRGTEHLTCSSDADCPLVCFGADKDPDRCHPADGTCGSQGELLSCHERFGSERLPPSCGVVASDAVVRGAAPGTAGSCDAVSCQMDTLTCDGGLEDVGCAADEDCRLACDRMTVHYVNAGPEATRPVAPKDLSCDPLTSDLIPVPSGVPGVASYQCACKPEYRTMFEQAADGTSCDVPTVCDGGYLASAHRLEECTLPARPRDVELEPRLVVAADGKTATLEDVPPRMVVYEAQPDERGCAPYTYSNMAFLVADSDKPDQTDERDVFQKSKTWFPLRGGPGGAERHRVAPSYPDPLPASLVGTGPPASRCARTCQTGGSVASATTRTLEDGSSIACLSVADCNRCEADPTRIVRSCSTDPLRSCESDQDCSPPPGACDPKRKICAGSDGTRCETDGDCHGRCLRSPLKSCSGTGTPCRTDDECVNRCEAGTCRYAIGGTSRAQGGRCRTDDDCNVHLGGICPDAVPLTCSGSGTSCRSDDDCRTDVHACPVGFLGDGGPTPKCDATTNTCDRILTLNRDASGRRVVNSSAGQPCAVDADCAALEFQHAMDRTCGPGVGTPCGHAMPCYDPDSSSRGKPLDHYYDYERVGVHESMRTMFAVWDKHPISCVQTGDCPTGSTCIGGSCSPPDFQGFHDFAREGHPDPRGHCVPAEDDGATVVADQIRDCAQVNGFRAAPYDLRKDAPVLQTTTSGETVVAADAAKCVCPPGTIAAADMHALDPNPGSHFRCVPDPCPSDRSTFGLVVPGVHTTDSGSIDFPPTARERREVTAARPVPQCACDDGYVDYSPAAGDRRSIVVEGEVRYSDVDVAAPTCLADACAPGRSERDHAKIACDSVAQRRAGVRPCAGHCDLATHTCFVASLSTCARACDVDTDCGDASLYTCSTDDRLVAMERKTSGGRRGVCVARTTCSDGMCPDGRTACASDRDCAAGIPKYVPDPSLCEATGSAAGRVVCVPPAGATTSPPACYRENMTRSLAGSFCTEDHQCDVGFCVGDEGHCSGGCVCPPGMVQHRDDTAPGGYTCVDVCDTYPCLNGGTCRVQYGRPVCDCLSSYEGNHCEIRK